MLPFVLWGYDYPSLLNSKSYLQDVRVLHYLYDMGCLTRPHGSLQMPQRKGCLEFLCSPELIK